MFVIYDDKHLFLLRLNQCDAPKATGRFGGAAGDAQIEIMPFSIDGDAGKDQPILLLSLLLDLFRKNVNPVFDAREHTQD